MHLNRQVSVRDTPELVCYRCWRCDEKIRDDNLLLSGRFKVERGRDLDHNMNQMMFYEMMIPGTLSGC